MKFNSYMYICICARMFERVCSYIHIGIRLHHQVCRRDSH